ncbi:FecR family protein [Acinetobacter nematophilus]|uniref:FecR domain-containing protein n=1 Tax=Acinetobacter nematophilus TaxID=2994642 RepID=A0A9X3DRA1_9GAMM|nr:FecR domain-containing protein [Acinetobacter nematophilus]MCX5466332.1 FecR domain-containing protein [Acinetobacter nematophilus]
MIEDQKSKQKLIEEAAEWIVLLSADDDLIKKTAKIDFDAWKSMSPQRQKIAQDIEQYLNAIQKLVQNPQQQQMTQSVLKAGLQSVNQQKNLHYGSMFAFALCFFGGMYSFFAYYPIAYLTADIRTSAGGWKTQSLKDGSMLKFRGQSAVNVHFSGHQRVVELVQGEIFVDVAKDKARPFIVQTQHGQIEALGTAFSVRYEPEFTALKMLHSKVKVQASHLGKQPSKPSLAIVSAGQEVILNGYGIQPVHDFNIHNEQQKWTQRQLIVENMPLSKVLAELDQNSQAKIIFKSDQLEKIQVNAVLPLDHTDNALKLLNSVFPQLRMYRITPYLTVVTTS